jgi:hypothetical protein
MNSNSTEFTAKDGRRFAFPVGTAFLVLSGILFWREKETAFQVTAALGGLLYVAGAIIPGLLGPVYRAWMGMALLISKVTTPIFMGVVYFVVLTPTGLIMRLLGRRPINHQVKDNGYWHVTAGRTPTDLRRQF